MTTVDMTNWEISFGGGVPAGAKTPCAQPDLKFQTSLELLAHLADDMDRAAGIQGRIDDRLKADPVAKAWHRQRADLKDMAHFPKYKGRHYDAYHTAARAVSSNANTAVQQAMTTGLNQEIAASKVIAPQGQILFHGRSDLTLHSGASYSSFISTSRTLWLP